MQELNDKEKRERAAKVIETMNEWRRSDRDIPMSMPCPFEFGRALDYAVKVLRSK